MDSEAVYREGCGGWGRHNLVLALSQIEDVDIVSLCAGKGAVFLGKNSALFRYLPGDEPGLWGGVHVDINCLCSHGDEVLVTPLA